MFAIQYNKIWLKLPESTTITLTQFSQIISENKLKGALTIPIDAPIQGNEQFFGGAELLKGISAGARMKAGFGAVKLYINGVWWMTGKLMILQINPDTISINLVMGLPGISSLDDKLEDLQWGEINMPTDPSDVYFDRYGKTSLFYTRINGGYDESTITKTFTFPLIKNLKFYGDNSEKNSDYLGIVNNYNEDISTFGFLGNLYRNENAICPMLYCIEILRKGFLKGGYKFDWSALPGDFHRLVQYNNYDLCRLVPAHGARAETTTDNVTLRDTGFFGSPALVGPILFDDETLDESECYNPATGLYFVRRPGRFRLDYNFPFHIIDYIDNPANYILKIVFGTTGGTIIDSEIYTINDPTTGSAAQKRAFFDLTESHVGLSLQIKYSYYESGTSIGSASSVVIEAGSWFKITCISNPTVNDFGTKIELAKCVPQGVIFRDYVNAFAATFNVEFEVDDFMKTVRAKCNEPDISNSPIHKEQLWIGNAKKPVIDYRGAKFGYLNYRWSGNDGLISGNFTVYPDSDYIGEDNFYWQLATDFPADETYSGKKVKILAENKIYVCSYNETSFSYEWVPFTDDYKPLLIGAGTETLELPISPLFFTHHAFDNFEMNVPHVSMEGNSKPFGMLNTDVGLRMISFYGRIVCPRTVGADTNMPYSYITKAPFTPTVGGAVTIGYSMELSRDESGTEVGILSFWFNTLRVMNLPRRIVKILNLRLDEILGWSFRKRAYMNGMVVMPEQLTIATQVKSGNIVAEGEFGVEEVELE